jgi:hypothetical protein
MADDVRQYLMVAQAAELRGEWAEAVENLNKAAQLYRQAGKSDRAEQMLRQAKRLEAKEPAPAGPDESAEFIRPERSLIERGPVLADPASASWCSFCCRPDREVGPLVAGPAGAFICGGCGAEASRLLGGVAVTEP